MKTNRVMNRDWRKKVAWFNAIIIFLIPLIVFYKRIEITEELKMYFGNIDATGDFFAYYKAKLLQFGALASLALTIYFKRKEGWKFKWDRYTILLALFSCSIILSTIMSEHKMVAIFGYPDRFEGAWTWLSYLMFSYSIYLFVETKQDIINTIKPFVYATGVASLIGAFQFIGLDLFSTNFGKWLILGSKYSALAESLEFRFPKGTVYTTLYNPNYIGTMVAMVVPLIVYLFEEVKENKHRILMVAIFILNIIALIGAKSTGGLVATAVVMFVMVINYTLKSKHRVKIGIVSLVIIAATVAAVSNTTLFDKQLGRLEKLYAFNEPTEQVIKDVQIDGSNLKVISFDGEEINVDHDNKSLFVYDKDMNLLSAGMDENGKVLISQELYKRWGFSYLQDSNKLNITYKADDESKVYKIEVSLVENGYTIFGPIIIDEDLNVKTVNWFKNENILTDRAYIWNRTIPLIFDHPIAGNGSDTFALEFLQNDIKGRANAGKVYGLIVDKPHSFVLGVAVNFGVIGLLVFAGIVVNALVGVKNQLMIILSIVGFFIAGIANDSTVFLTFVLFVILGMFSSVKNQEIHIDGKRV